MDLGKIANSIAGLTFRVVFSAIWRLDLYSFFAVAFACAMYFILKQSVPTVSFTAFELQLTIYA